MPSWAFNTPWEERLVDYHGHKTWCRIIGKEATESGGLFGIFGKNKADNAARLTVILALHVQLRQCL